MGLKKWPPTFSQTWAGAEKTKTFQIADFFDKNYPCKKGRKSCLRQFMTNMHK